MQLATSVWSLVRTGSSVLLNASAGFSKSRATENVEAVFNLEMPRALRKPTDLKEQFSLDLHTCESPCRASDDNIGNKLDCQAKLEATQEGLWEPLECFQASCARIRDRVDSLLQAVEDERAVVSLVDTCGPYTALPESP